MDVCRYYDVRNAESNYPVKRCNIEKQDGIDCAGFLLNCEYADNEKVIKYVASVKKELINQKNSIESQLEKLTKKFNF